MRGFEALLEAAIAGALVFVAVDHWAPPQDLPWKPLSLDQPIGLATMAKLDRIATDAAQCRRVLREGGVRFQDVSAHASAPACQVTTPVRPRLGLRPEAPLMSCALALRVAIWSRQALPAAAQASGQEPVVSLHQAGTYACRGVRSDRGVAVLSISPSAHARAAAIDITGFTLADGRTISVSRDWSRPGPNGAFLHRARDSACALFPVALSPDYNAVHRDHLHLDLGPYRACR
jgi:hypothetical protein